MPKIPAKWLKLFKLIPGYDPVATTAPGEFFRPAAADGAVRFFAERLSHVEGAKAGQPLVLEPWQQALVGCVFGWKRADGTRRYREVFQYVPRKNGKTTLCGGLVNLIGFVDDEAGAQIYCAAAEREQAALVFRQTRGMIEQSPQLSQSAKIYLSLKSVEYPQGKTFKALSADAITKHGFNTHFAVIDELHAQPNRELVDVLATSTGSRRQPMIWYITTADFDRISICNEKYEYACKVRDGIIQDSAFLPCIFEAKADEDWKLEATWRKANPNLGVSVSLEYLQRECLRAQEQPSYENIFRRLHLNQRTQQDVRWLPMDAWDACGAEPLDASQLEGAECFAGLDLSSTIDITALVLFFPELAACLSFFWIPDDRAAERERRDRVPYLAWSQRGWMEMTPGNVVDYRYVRKRVNELADRFHFTFIGYDPWNARQIAMEMKDEDGLPMVEYKQGYISLNEPSKMLEKMVVGRTLRHGGNPVLRWMASNCAVESDAAGNIKPSKKRSSEKIDGIVALVMAVGLAFSQDVDGGDSVYNQRGLLTL